MRVPYSLQSNAPLSGRRRAAFRYSDAERNVFAETGRVLGMMPHPERLYEAALGGTDGRRGFESALPSVLEAA